AISIQEEGRYNLSFYATDRVNNQEGLHFVMVVVDDAPPEIVANFNTAPTGVRTDAGSEQNVYRVGTRIFLAATDEAAGAERIMYSINGDEEQEYDTPINLFEAGEYEVQLRAIDHVGNETSEELRFIIE
ncbi:MAG: OmpL47-type beta-barrel domain-containing protein, partial [Cyclonatronaceae bacterium]